MAKMIGIDLGTTNSAVAIIEGPRPKMLDSRENRPLTRSVVSLKRRMGAGQDEEGEILVGDVAFDNWPRAPKDTIVSIKRLMGRGMADPAVQRAQQWSVYDIVEPSRGTKDSVRVVMGGKEYSPVEISAMILAKLRDDADYRIGETPTHAVITVPAYFSFAQKAATRQAGEKAGLHVIKILDEPTAAAVAHGIESGDSQAKTMLVYDFGGGTFDVSVLMIAGGVFAPLNLQGDMWLGGDNLDEVIVDKAVRYVKEEFGVDPTSNFRFMVVLKKVAQEVKERLSAAGSADLVVTGLLQSDGDLIDVELEVTRDEFERMILPLVATYKECGCGQANFSTDDRCAKCGGGLQDSPVKDGKTVQIVRKALHNADLSPDQIDHVLMAGNSTSVPLVQQSMEEMFGREKILRTIQPKHCVAMGAAIIAARFGPSKWVCQAPDPADPSAECGHVNTDADVCEKCGAPRKLEREEPAPVEPGGEPISTGEIDIGGIQIGGVAPLHYGAEVAGDKFIIFVRKGDSYPTDNPQVQTFFTRLANQRMISIPIWGGEELEVASANTKQGEAFAILPPGLSKGTPVRVDFWLNDEGGPLLKAYLEDGTDLQAWIVKGEEDAKAIESIENVEKLLASMGDAMPPQERHKVDQARDRAFKRLREGDFDGALKDAENMEKKAEGISRPVEPTLQAKAENLIRFTEYVLHQYNWALDPDQAYRLSELVEETKSALEQGDEARLEEKVPQLNKATDDLPEAISVFLGLKGAIASRIQPRDVAQAASLLQELEDVENAFKSRDPAARQQLVAFAPKVVEAINRLEEQQIARCPACGCKLEPGQRYCEQGHDTWGLAAGIVTSSDQSGTI